MAITTQDILDTADRIAAEGGTPTLAAVRSALGGGSFTTISEAMKAWKASKQVQATPMRDPAPAAVADRMGEVATEIWALALELANGRLQSEREALDVARAEMEQAQAEAAELADQLAAELEGAQATVAEQAAAAAVLRAEIERQADQVGRLTAELGESKTGAQATAAALTEAHARVDQLSSMLDQERAARSAAEKKAGEAEQQVAVLATIETGLRADLAVSKSAEDASRAKIEELISKLAAAQISLTTEQAENARFADKLAHQCEINSLLKKENADRVAQLSSLLERAEQRADDAAAQAKK